MRLTLLYFVAGLILLAIFIAFTQCGDSDSVTVETDTNLPKPELLSPENGSEQSSVVSFRWQGTDETEAYQILISLTENFSSSLADSISDSTQFEIEGLPNDTTIYWKVRSIDKSHRGPWSDVYVFTTGTDPDNSEPLTTTLKSPANSIKVQTTDVTLRWIAVANASGYNVQLTTDQGFTSFTIDSVVDSPFHQVYDLSGSETYYWRVEPIVKHRETQWSEVFTFSMGGIDTVGPDLSVSGTPPNAAEGDTVTISATASDSSGISRIELYVDEDNVETCSASTTCNYSDNSYGVGTHSYHAVAVDASSGANQSRSETKNFRITDGSSPGDTVKIMPLGNSITEAFGYRIPLWDKLTEAGYSIDYVGSQSDSHPDLPDTDHEGHGGWYIGHVSKEINDWLATYRPDYVLLMIGTNDIAWWTPRNGAEIADAHAELVDQILANSPTDTWLLVASIPPQSSEIVEPNKVDRAQLTRDFNQEMEKRMQQRIDDGKQIVFVDIHPKLSVNDLSDGIHPNKQGYETIAQTWFEALLTVLP